MASLINVRLWFQSKNKCISELLRLKILYKIFIDFVLVDISYFLKLNNYELVKDSLSSLLAHSVVLCLYHCHNCLADDATNPQEARMFTVKVVLPE